MVCAEANNVTSNITHSPTPTKWVLGMKAIALLQLFFFWRLDFTTHEGKLALLILLKRSNNA
ncbi:hypothetical protein, partial [Spirulina sp. 06S082]|uniref:hypothetical protein n=1 Tax=Spirulina sp. 06S082 TaxID=3110248 RepID=UPI002B1EFA49